MLVKGDIVEYTGVIPDWLSGTITEYIMKKNLKIGNTYTIFIIELGDGHEWCRLEENDFWYPLSSFSMFDIKKKYNLK